MRINNEYLVVGQHPCDAANIGRITGVMPYKNVFGEHFDKLSVTIITG